MVYVTGDMHGDYSCFKRRALRRLKKGDTLIVCGDFGFLFDDSKKEEKWLKKIGRQRYNTVFVEGVHDNLNLIEKYPAEEWNGGMTHIISGRLRHLCRGNIFNVDGLTLFVFGGGEPPTANDVPWGDRLLPSQEDIDSAQKRLRAAGSKADYIITHCCGHKLKSLLTMVESNANVMDDFFDEIRKNVSYKGWMFAGYHIDRHIPPFDVALFEEVIKLGVPVEMRNKNTTKRLRVF